ncbi:MAG: UDP-N-acetylmuramoyl-tripeptide--D-alanyl-D-alanine ligase [Candidatus Hydrogenedentes bacterium]|nr:UDP-N-acetylmuramoyl-tripeptide--D-alanyl-D-alanine ligase [Candidatus Hydrogenedentota bacterium]
MAAGWAYSLDTLAAVVGARTPEVNPTFHAVSTDTRTLQAGDLFFALRGDRFDGNRFVPDAFAKGACAAVTCGAVEGGPCLVVDDPLAALQAFAAHHRSRYTLPLLALTGSCGKTGTKDLAAALLAGRHRVVKTLGNLNNEIGCPLSLLHIDAATDVAVIEMGANHAGEIARLCAMARPTEAAITMIAPAHLEGFGSIENVAKAKAEIVEALENRGTFYVNVDDEWCVRIAGSHRGPQVRFGSSGDVALEACEPDGPGGMRLRVAPVGELRLPLLCRAHVSNVLLAIAIGLQHGVDEFEGPLREACAATSRLKLIRIGPLSVIDDTYNANPASMAAALRTLGALPGARARIAALGDMLELGDAADALHREAGELAAQLGVTHLFARGDYAGAVVAAAREAGACQAEVIESHRDMAEAIGRIAAEGDALLVKGSRGMRMEQVIEALQESYGA